MLYGFVEFVNRISPPFVTICIAACGAIMGDYFAKLYSQTPKDLFFVLTILGYAISSVMFIPVLFKKNLVIASLIWYILTNVGLFVIGFLVFHEKISFTQAVGVVLTVAGGILLTVGE